MTLRIVSRLCKRHIRFCGKISMVLCWLLVLFIVGYIIDSYVLTREKVISIYGNSNSSVDTSDDSAVETSSVIQSSIITTVSTTGSTGRSSTVQPLSRADNCGVKRTCHDGRVSYLVRSGQGRYGQPHICFNGHFYMSPEKRNGNRGLNLVVINEKTLKLEDIRTFDVYEDDSVLIRFINLGVADNRLFLIASLDEASARLSATCRSMLHVFGATLIDRLHFRDNYVMFGQKGLTRGSAIESIAVREMNKEFADVAEIKGCTGVPLGRLNTSLPASSESMQTSAPELRFEPTTPGPTRALGAEKQDCGVEQTCRDNEFSLHLYTGADRSDYPKICVSGKYVLSSSLGNAGRGLNVVVLNPDSKTVKRVAHFDTFTGDSRELEVFLDLLSDQDIILVTAFDEASTRLSDTARHSFTQLGSALIQNLRFRDVWAFVGQKGIQGFTDIEQIEYAGNSWPTPIDKRICVATQLVGSKIKPDPLITRNVRRREFCSMYTGYDTLCDVAHIDDLLTAAPLSDASLDKSPLFTVPILLIAGTSRNGLGIQLETLLMNPGVQSGMVTIVYDELLAECSVLAELFSFRSVKLPHFNNYMDLMHAALELVWQAYPDADYVIVLEEDVILSHDYLALLAQLLPVVDVDDSLVGVSAWNVNGYAGLSRRPDLAYRVREFPGLGFLLKRDVYESYMKGRLKHCCSNRAWEGWTLDDERLEMIVPDASRVYRRTTTHTNTHTDTHRSIGTVRHTIKGTERETEIEREMFNRERVTNVQSQVKILNPELLVQGSYEAELHRLISHSQALPHSSLRACGYNSSRLVVLPDHSVQYYTIYYTQTTASEESVLYRLCHCFQLFHVTGASTRGKHRGLIRFTYLQSELFLIGSSTEYYKHKPASVQPITAHDLYLL